MCLCVPFIWRSLHFSVRVSYFCVKDKDVTYKKFTYHPWVHSKFNKKFYSKYQNIILMLQNKYFIKTLLNSNMKDQISCKKIWHFIKSTCKKIYMYIGKTKRDLETRINEHFRNIENWEIEKSVVAGNIWKWKHTMDWKPVLLKQASNKHKLTNWENLFN
jgi:GIY-YIG catalytic domain.